MNTTQKEKEITQGHKRPQGRCQKKRESKMHSLETTVDTLRFGMHTCKEPERNKHSRGSDLSGRN